MRHFKDLLQALPEAVVRGNSDLIVSGIYYDSRLVQRDGAFVCINGFNTDGHKYIANAVQKGAVVIVAEKEVTVPEGITLVITPNTRQALAKLACAFYHDPSTHLNLIGVTGTNGKTSITYLVRAILRQNGYKVGLLGTIANLVEDQVLPSIHTTPEASDLQQLFSQMEAEKVNYAVMEVSSHALELGRVAGSEFDIAVFTNLTQDHLDFHLSFENYFQAKSKLFASLKPGAKQRPKYAVLNYDDPHYKALEEITRVPVVSYGLSAGAMYRAKDIQVRLTGVSYTLEGPFGSLDLNLKMTGWFSVYNSLAACTVGLEEGISPEVVKTAVEQMTGVPGRFELVDCGQDFAVVVDYAHTPDGLENVLKTAKQVTQGRVITVFGCGGDRDRSKRPLMGEKAAELSDFCFVTSDNPRTENPEAIIADIVPGLQKISKGVYAVVADRKAAIAAALQEAKRGDIVVIAGKGHEKYQIIGKDIFPFDDVQIAKECLNSSR
ncbi:UDP-N-acetylmuramoyl-L-alanyl-D-glutamate--2,6-diaminopimelate ligase [Bacillota bacterium LX-D]|nr:UDP-N-acetylmuramoyl-L-alanyl-D-glutamate--2,6-diaminopimelate ligase [Bacillota bacterium LX-D]